MIAMAMLPVALSSSASVMKKAWKMGVKSVASRLTGFASGFAGTRGMAAPGVGGRGVGVRAGLGGRGGKAAPGRGPPPPRRGGGAGRRRARGEQQRDHR